MKSRLLLLSLSLLIAIGACAQQTPFAQERAVGTFSKIDVCCGIDLYITQDVTQPQPSVIRVEVSDEDWLEKVNTKVVSNELQISISKWSGRSLGWKRQFIKVYVTVNDLAAVKAGAGADVASSGILKVDALVLNSHSGADIELEIEGNKVEATSTSGSDIKLKGRVAQAVVQAESGADIKMKELVAAKVLANASSGGDIVLTVTEELNATASSGGDIDYYGEPKVMNKNSNSGGSIKAKR